MIKKFCFAAFAALAVSSCCEKSMDLPGEEKSEEVVTFSVSVSQPETRSLGVTDASERNVNSIQVVVFDKYGLYETSAKVEKDEAEITCTAGEKKVVVLVNAPEQTGIVNYADLASRKVYLKDSGVGNLIMVGETTVSVTAGKKVALDVFYISSKVELRSVSLDLGYEPHRNLSFAVTSVYLTNVAGDRCLIAESAPSVWFHEGIYDASNTLPFLYDKVSEGTLAHGGQGYDPDHVFYCFPNLKKHNPAQKTRLVIEVQIEGQTYYYPIVIDEVLPNNEYSYAVKLTRLGIDSPDESLDKGSYEVLLYMQDWVQKTSTVII